MMSNSSYKTKSNLYIFTSSFPYSFGETFLANELIVIAPHFEKVKLLPHYNPSGNNKTRVVPDNVEFDKPILKHNIVLRSLIGLFNFAPILPHLRDLKNLFRDGKNLNYNIKQWYLSLLSFRCLYCSKQFKELKNNLSENDILYFYWGRGSSSILLSLTHKNTFVRFHRVELDFEGHFGYIPLIKEMVKHSSNLLPISEVNQNILSNKFKHNRVYLNRLGVFDNGISPFPMVNDTIRIVSCSFMSPIKRIHLIIEALSGIVDVKIEWIHFGGGILFDEISKLAGKSLSENINVQFLGMVANSVIIDYYKNNYVDLFINTSLHEGIPVTIMEAISFGIPCFATNVGGTSEIINSTTGYLVDVNFNLNRLTSTIQTVRKDFDVIKRKEIRSFWDQNYNAIKNYENLAIILSQNNGKLK